MCEHVYVFMYLSLGFASFQINMVVDAYYLHVFLMSFSVHIW